MWQSDHFSQEKFEVNKSFLSLAEMAPDNWTGLWDNMRKEYLEIKAREIPQLLNSVEKINL